MIQVFHNKQKIILASGSPRRRDYFRDLGLSFHVERAKIEEKSISGEKAVDYTRRLAREKAKYVAEVYPDQWIVAADTVVCCDEHILEKPVDEQDALLMLMRLCGREHVVRTAICLYQKEKGVSEICSVATRVKFWNFSREAARRYIQTGEPLDKAGSYGIQGKGAFLVHEIHGSYSNVVGLPLVECIEMLVYHGVIEG